MAVVVAEKDVDAFIALAAQENLAATPVAVVTDDRRMKMLFKGRTIVDISRDFLDTNGVKQVIAAEICDDVPQYFAAGGADFREGLVRALSDLNVCSKKGLSEMFDSDHRRAHRVHAFRRQDAADPRHRHGCQDLRRRNGRRDRLRLRLLF